MSGESGSSKAPANRFSPWGQSLSLNTSILSKSPERGVVPMVLMNRLQKPVDMIGAAMSRENRTQRASWRLRNCPRAASRNMLPMTTRMRKIRMAGTAKGVWAKDSPSYTKEPSMTSKN